MLQRLNGIRKDRFNRFNKNEGIAFFISLLGRFYTIIGIDKNEPAIDNKFYRSTNFLIVSPENEYKDHFISVGKRIEEQFKQYRFVPFFICKQIIDSLSWEFKEKSTRVFQEIFNDSVDLDVNTIGNEVYQSSQWAIENGTTDKWTISGLL